MSPQKTSPQKMSTENASTENPSTEKASPAKARAGSTRLSSAADREGMRPPGAGRPRRTPFVLLVLTVLGAGLCALLVLNTATAASEVRERQLDAANSSLTDSAQQLSRDIADAQAPQNLARMAAALGLVPADSPAFLRINADGSGTVLGSAKVVTAPVNAEVLAAQAQVSAAQQKADDARAAAKNKDDRARAAAEAQARAAEKAAKAAAAARARTRPAPTTATTTPTTTTPTTTTAPPSAGSGAAVPR